MPGDAEAPPLRRERIPFALTEGGPFYRILVRLRLRTPTSMTRCWWLGVALWLPLVLGEGARTLLGMPEDPTLFDLSLHVRLLFTLPVLLVSERLVDQTVNSALTTLYKGNFCDPGQIDDIVDRAQRLRDSWKVELGILAVSILGGQLVLWRVFGSTGLFHGGAEVGFWSFPRLWYALIALPLVQFVMLRWMWRWVIWSLMVARISRLPLFVLATHSDHAGGLAALARPVSGFCGFVLANGAILSAAWATQIIEARTTVQALLPMLTAYLVVVLVIAVGPLLLLSGHLFRARRRTLAQYGDFMRAYALQFHDKWVASPTGASAVGSPDIQSLNDLMEAYQVISKTRFFVFGPRQVLAVWSAGLLPLLPLVLSTITFEQVLRRILATVLGGLPLGTG